MELAAADSAGRDLDGWSDVDLDRLGAVSSYSPAVRGGPAPGVTGRVRPGWWLTLYVGGEPGTDGLVTYLDVSRVAPAGFTGRWRSYGIFSSARAGLLLHRAAGAPGRLTDESLNLPPY